MSWDTNKFKYYPTYSKNKNKITQSTSFLSKLAIDKVSGCHLFAQSPWDYVGYHLKLTKMNSKFLYLFLSKFKHGISSESERGEVGIREGVFKKRAGFKISLAKTAHFFFFFFFKISRNTTEWTSLKIKSLLSSSTAYIAQLRPSYFSLPYNQFHFTLKFQIVLLQSDCMCLNQGYFLVSSPAANAETSPHIKAESLVRIYLISFFPFKFEISSSSLPFYFALSTTGTSRRRVVSRARVSQSNCKNKHTHTHTQNVNIV